MATLRDLSGVTVFEGTIEGAGPGSSVVQVADSVMLQQDILVLHDTPFEILPAFGPDTIAALLWIAFVSDSGDEYTLADAVELNAYGISALIDTASGFAIPLQNPPLFTYLSLVGPPVGTINIRPALAADTPVTISAAGANPSGGTLTIAVHVGYWLVDVA